MINLSASLIKEYLSCKRKGYYRINYPEQAIQTDDMIIGNVVHKTLEKCWDKNRSDAIEFAFAELSKYNLVDPNQNRINKISISISNFFREGIYLLSDNDIIEKFFKVPYSDDACITGKMDRITKDKVIIDWKSSYSVPENIDNDIQFIIYYMSYKQLYGEFPNKVFYIALGSKGKIIEFHPKDYYIKTLYDSIIPNIINDIKNNRFERTGFYNNSCLNCQFQLTCWGEL